LFNRTFAPRKNNSDFKNLLLRRSKVKKLLSKLFQPNASTAAGVGSRIGFGALSISLLILGGGLVYGSIHVPKETANSKHTKKIGSSEIQPENNRQRVSVTGNFDSSLNSGCQKMCSKRAGHRNSEVKEQPGASVGDITRCPVSGVAFQVTNQVPSHNHLGTVLYFCCKECMLRFLGEPKRFVSLERT
jgi:YHS domain-containing protein